MPQPNQLRRAPTGDPALEACARICARTFLVVVGSVVAAAMGDVGVEVSLALRAFGGGYVDRSQVTIVPVAAFAAALLLLGLAWSRMNARHDDRWLAAFARDTARTAAFRGNVLATTLLALPAALAMEHLERLLGGGLPFGGLPLLSTAGIVVVAMFCASAALVVATLAAIMRSVVAAFDLVARAMHVALTWFHDRCAREHRDVRLGIAVVCRHRASALFAGRCNPDRAPPWRSLAALIKVGPKTA